MLNQSDAIPFYLEVYCGRHSQNFAASGQPRHFARAAALLETLTFGRVHSVCCPTIERKVCMAQCALVDELIADDEAPARVVSETTAHVSVTYCDTDRQAQQRRYRAAVMQYLGDTGLLYRGGGA